MTISRNLSILAEGISSSGVLGVTNGGTGVTTSTGTGNTVLSASPTLTGTLTVPTVSSPSATSLTLQSAGTTAMTIDTSQNVGIGTSSPTAKLDVTGVSRYTFNVGNAYTLQTSVNAAVSAFVDSYNNAAQHIWQIGGTERIRIDSSGNVGIGTASPNASAILDAQSTTKGVCFPNMTTTQKNAVSSPAAGLVVFDTTLSKLCVYSGAAWQTITSV